MRHKTNTTFSLPLSNTGVSPVIGATLMVALVVIFTTMISGVILSQYDTPKNPPTADVNFDQNAHSNIDQTSNIRITIIEDYNSERINITTRNKSITLYDSSDGDAYIAYKTDNTTACSNAGKTINSTKPYCILKPSDSSYSQRYAQGKTTGDEIYVCHANEGMIIQIIAINDYGQEIASVYTVRYIEGLEQYTVLDKYDNPC